jgi:hypothetical protein
MTQPKFDSGQAEAIRKFGSEFPHRLDECKECGLTWGEHSDSDCPRDLKRTAEIRRKAALPSSNQAGLTCDVCGQELNDIPRNHYSVICHKPWCSGVRPEIIDALQILVDRIEAATQDFIDGGKYILTYSEIANAIKTIVLANRERKANERVITENL